MLTTAAARERILSRMPSLGAEDVPLDDAVGRVLAGSVRAERDQPPFDRVTMDGIAIRHADLAGGRRAFPVQATMHAGDAAVALDDGACIEIMTGAALPPGADTVVPVERIDVQDGVAGIEAGYEPAQGQFVHRRASDYARDTELLAPGSRISPLDVAVIASSGLAQVRVAREPRVRVVSTGNELVPAGKPIEPEQIRLSNGPAVVAMLRQHGYRDVRHDHLPDRPELLEERIRRHLDESDALVLSGGVSMGKADFVPAVLARLGVEVDFHKVSQRPGKPMWFGVTGDGKPVFALPGNPVSTLVCCRHYVMPALSRAAGAREPRIEFASLAKDVSFEPALTCFLPVRLLSNVAGQVLALPVEPNTSGDFASLSGTDGYVELALEQREFPAGTSVPLYRWRLH